MRVKLVEHHFSGKDPTKAVDFLTSFVREANIQKISEAEAVVALPSFQKVFASAQFEAGVEIASPEKGGISDWPEAVQYLSRNYAQSPRTSSAISDLSAVSREPTKTRHELYIWLGRAICRCANFHRPEEVLILYTDPLHTATRMVVARYRESPLRAVYLDIVDFAQHEGDAVWARTISSQLG